MHINRQQIVSAAANWAARPATASTINAYLGVEIDRIGDARWGEAGKSYFGVDVADPLLWANRIIDLGAGDWALTGIRYRGLDVSQPFIDIIATSLTPELFSFDHCTEILRQYECFKPLAMRIFTPVVWPNVAVDQYVVSAPIATIASHFSPTLENVQLRGMSADEAIKVERSIYTKLREVNPRISRKFHLLTADQISPGMAWSVSTDGELIGMVACAIDSQFGIDGIALTSICLVPQHHGKKFGKATLIHLARELADSEAYKTKELWGHIDGYNQVSLANAQSVGREIVGAYVWSESVSQLQ